MHSRRDGPAAAACRGQPALFFSPGETAPVGPGGAPEDRARRARLEQESRSPGVPGRRNPPRGRGADRRRHQADPGGPWGRTDAAIGGDAPVRLGGPDRRARSGAGSNPAGIPRRIISGRRVEMRAPRGENFEALFLIPVALAGAFRGLARDIPPRSPADRSPTRSGESRPPFPPPAPPSWRRGSMDGPLRPRLRLRPKWLRCRRTDARNATVGSADQATSATAVEANRPLRADLDDQTA
jgi:hypothetical protein